MINHTASMIGEDKGRGYNCFTYSGKPFYPLDPQEEDIRIEDIAHALAMQCRFNGHTRDFYSVAQHSVLHASYCPDNLKLCGLLHDASEAYIGDLIRPLKPYCQSYKDIELKIESIIAKKYGIPFPYPTIIKEIDNRMAVTERRDLLVDSPNVDWGDMPPPFEETIYPWSPKEAEEKFLDLFFTLS